MVKDYNTLTPILNTFVVIKEIFFEFITFPFKILAATPTWVRIIIFTILIIIGILILIYVYKNKNELYEVYT